ncbi:winged helix-turn-helix domain-containing protein [Puniceibacterium sp. IMCC21224]|uniref:winged helix-turn-helix domain-containing protein n=1 Tax=Puniceibacterium sp. IMCC21224 TaxID=1618204 RepID=UPI00065CE8A3|nr:winged helix-turn-helix domain-containing protein [Puniceibacterium sp. IMCC21224]KMK66724.1 transcriptional regulatory protein [Puniceibacterium sp. IMCC21224]
MLRRALIISALMLPLSGGTIDTPDDYLDRLVTPWMSLDPSALRFAIWAEPIIKTMVIWDSRGTRVFPPANTIPHVSEEHILSDIERLNALRATSTTPVWDIASKGAERYYQCTPLRCLDISGPDLATALGRVADDHRFLIEGDTNHTPLILLVGGVLLCALAGIAVMARPARSAHGTPPDPDSFGFGHTTINPRQMTVDCDGTLSDLTLRDLKLIEIFRRRSGDVCSKDDLYDTGWGQTFHANSRALEQHILTLRRKLDPDRRHPGVIETVHGRGYRYTG